MMEKIFISVEKSSRMISLTKKYIGNDLENLQQELVFKFTDQFVNGSARLEYQVGNNKYHIPMTKDGETYTVPIKNVITKEGRISMQLVIVQTAQGEEIPVFKSNVFDMYCNKSINAQEEAPDDYEYWLDVIQTKLADIDDALEQVDNLDIDATKTGGVATVSITNKDGVTKSVEITDGRDGEKGETGPANTLVIGTVVKGDDANATITGDAPNQTLNLVLPKGDKGEKGDTGNTGAAGPANTLTIGTVSKGDNASATITGTSPNQVLNLVLPKGDKGDTGATGPQGNPGANGTNGQDGFSPIATVTQTQSGATISITDKNGTTTANVTNGQDGEEYDDTEIRGLIAEKQDELVSGTNIKTINNTSILGSGNIEIQGGGASDYSDLTNKPSINNVTLSGNKTSSNLGLQDILVSGTNIKTINNETILGQGNINLSNYKLYGNNDLTLWYSYTGVKNIENINIEVGGNTHNIIEVIPMFLTEPISEMQYVIGEMVAYLKAFKVPATSYIDSIASKYLVINILRLGTISLSIVESNGEYIFDFIYAYSTYRDEYFYTADISGETPELEVIYALSDKQDELVSGTNIKTINNTSLLGSGNIDIQSGSSTNVKINGTSITSQGEANIVTEGIYNANTNKIATINDLPDISGKQNITDDTLTTTNKTVPTAINEVNSIAKGANKAISYSNYQSMITQFNTLGKDYYNVGQSIYIVTLNVPDLWISGMGESSSTYTYVDDATFINTLQTNGYVQVGYYRFSMLETLKVDLTNYQTKIDSTHKLSSDLVDDTSTTNKFVTSAEKTTWNNKYDKPSGGIPATDLASAVQTSLGKADGSVQLETAMQIIKLSTGNSGDTVIGLKSNAASCYMSFAGASGWIGSYGVTVNKTPIFYNGSTHILAYTSDIPDVTGKEDTSNKVTSISSSSTNIEYPSALAVYNYIQSLDASEVNY